MIITKDLTNKITSALEAFSGAVRSLDETVEDLLIIYQNAAHNTLIDEIEATGKDGIEIISNIVAKETFIKISEMKSPSRKREITEARQIAMSLCHQLLNKKVYSLKMIGQAFGGRDHSTVIYACNTVDDLIDTDKDFKRKFEYIKSKIKVEELENNSIFETSDLQS